MSSTLAEPERRHFIDDADGQQAKLQGLDEEPSVQEHRDIRPGGFDLWQPGAHPRSVGLSLAQQMNLLAAAIDAEGTVGVIVAGQQFHRAQDGVHRNGIHRQRRFNLPRIGHHLSQLG